MEISDFCGDSGEDANIGDSRRWLVYDMSTIIGGGEQQGTSLPKVPL